MTTVTTTVDGPATRTAAHGNTLSWLVSDSIAVTGRYLKAYQRVPQLLVFSTIQPIMFVLLFRYVFGSAIPISDDVSYVDYLMPGIFVQTVLFGSTSTGVGLAEDAGKGLLERFQSLPMSRAAVLIGRTLADLVRNIFVVILMTAVGFAVGFRFHNGIGNFVLCLTLIVVFGFAFSWVAAVIGLGAPNSEAAQAAIFPFIFPLTFASSAFVPTYGMPDALRWFAEHQPVSIVVDAARTFVLGTVPPTKDGHQVLLEGSAGGKLLVGLLWTAMIIAVAAPLAVRAYRRKTG